MMDVNILYKSSSDALLQARLSQSQISQKEFELRLTEINNQYSPYNNPYVNIMQKQSIESEIIRLKNERDNHVFSAINYAMQLANIELQNKNVFSMAYLAISSINSFLSSETITSLSLPFTLQSQISQLYFQLVGHHLSSPLSLEIQRLKERFHIY